jgi:hypothetical protein
MNWKAIGVVVLIGAAMTSPARAGAAADVLRGRLVVRTYAATNIGPDDWRAMIDGAGAILEMAGIDVEWVDCGGGTAGASPVPSRRCEPPLRRNEVAMRIVRLRTAPSYRGELPLGESLIDPARTAGALATIYLDRVEWFARAGHTSTRTVLARAVAHELGHLALGTHEHSVSGLMRQLWTCDELSRGRATDWQIPADDGTRMRRALLARLAE